MFSRDDTKALKGLAVLLMMFHHLVGFPERYPPDFEGFQTIWRGFSEKGLLSALAGFCNICVCIFFFLGGYGMYLRHRKGRFHLGKQIKRLYFAYWRVLILIVPVALIFFRRSPDQLPQMYHYYDLQDARAVILTLLGNFTGFTCSLNGEWWFFKSYVCMMPMGFLFCLLMKKTRRLSVDLLIVCAIDFVRRVIIANISNTVLFAGANGHLFFFGFLCQDVRATMLYLGVVCAKHDILVRLKQQFERLRFTPVYGFAAIIGLFYLRSFLTFDYLDIFYIPLLTAAASVILDGIRPLKKGMVFFGGQSTNMWLLHTFFCYYFYETAVIVYSTRSPLIDGFILLAFTLGASLLVNLFWKLMKPAAPKLKRILLKPEAAPAAETE